MTKLPWWESDVYSSDESLPAAFTRLAGPNGPALVRAWPDGRTDAGWGLTSRKPGQDGFAKCYARGEFNSRRILYGYDRDAWAFAIVMRSVKLLCIDIDGKNGGLEHVKKLGALPLTLAETSMSGTGYHLFYEVDDEWSDDFGFGALGDRIGIVTGVDIRGIGCVYHHKQQRWNGRKPAKLPEHLYDLLRKQAQKVEQSKARVRAILSGDDELEIMMLQSELESELKKPIPMGKRNQTLFAIGSQMQDAEVENWEDLIHERAGAVGLDGDEANKLVENIKRYQGQYVHGLSPTP